MYCHCFHFFFHFLLNNIDRFTENVARLSYILSILWSVQLGPDFYTLFKSYEIFKGKQITHKLGTKYETKEIV